MAKSKLPGLYWDPATGRGEINKRVNGQRIHCRITAHSWQEAEAVYYRTLSAANERKGDTPPTFEEAATRYLSEETKTSLARDAQGLVKIVPWIGRLPLDSVHDGALRPYIEHQKGQGLKSATIARELAVVRRILTLAARRWRDSNNKPWLREVPEITLPDWKDRANPFPLLWEEQVRLLAALPAHLRDMAVFGLNTGSREAVICNLQWRWETQVPELGTSVFIVPAEEGDFRTKNGTDFVLVLNKAAREVVESRRGEHREFVFTYRGNPVQRMNNSGWRKAWRQAGLPTADGVLAGTHTLRHTFARRLRLAKVPPEVVKALMHHIDNSIDRVYAPIALQEMLEAVEKLSSVEKMTMLRRAM